MIKRYLEFLINIIKQFQNCVKIFNIKTLHLFRGEDNVSRHVTNSDVEIELTTSNSVLKVSSSYTAASNYFLVSCHIEVECKQAEFQGIEDVAKPKARKLMAEPKTKHSETKVKADEKLAKLHLKLINRKAEEKLLASSGHGSSVSVPIKPSKSKIVLQPRVVGSHLKQLPSDQKMMNFT